MVPPKKAQQRKKTLKKLHSFKICYIILNIVLHLSKMMRHQLQIVKKDRRSPREKWVFRTLSNRLQKKEANQ
jgi:hypothetical protein